MNILKVYKLFQFQIKNTINFFYDEFGTFSTKTSGTTSIIPDI